MPAARANNPKELTQAERAELKVTLDYWGAEFELKLLERWPEPLFDRFLKLNPLLFRLVKALHFLGFTVRFLPNHTLLTAQNQNRPAIGQINFRSNTVFISKRDPDGRSFSVVDMAQILAHELRHAMHQADGLFPAVYSSTPSLSQLSEITREIKAQVELDCDAYAAAYLAIFAKGRRSSLNSESSMRAGEHYRKQIEQALGGA